MKEKLPEHPIPVLAILAGPSAPVSQYLTQLARMAGWDARPVEEGALSVRVDNSSLIFSGAGADMQFSLPVRASQVLSYLRRARSVPATLPQILFDTYTLIPADYLLLDQAGQAIRLTEKETAILVCLGTAKGQPVSRQDLLDAVWAYAPGVETHTLETHIYRLRQKIEDDPANPTRLVTQEEGYTLAV